MDKPLKSLTYGQWDTRLTVTFPATGHHCPLTGTKLYCLVTEAHACKQLAQGYGQELNPQCSLKIKATQQARLTSICGGCSSWPATTSLSADIVAVKASTRSDLAHVVSATSNSLLTCRTSARHRTSIMSPVKHTHNISPHWSNAHTTYRVTGQLHTQHINITYRVTCKMHTQHII